MNGTMDLRRINLKDRRWQYGLLALLVLLALIYRFGPDMTAVLFSGNSEVASKEKQLARYRAAAARRGAVEERLEALRQNLSEGERYLLQGKSESLAAVEVQNMLNGLAARSSVEIRTVRVLKAEALDAGYFLTVAVKFSVTATIRQLKEFLYRIETANKLLKIEEVRFAVSGRRPDEPIRADVTVAGFMRKP